MVNDDSIGARITRWAEGDASIRALVMIGSRARSARGAAHGADAHSDWDFHVVASRPELFARRDWMRDAAIPEPLAYVDRLGRLGSAMKVSVLLCDDQLDLVILPERQLKRARLLWRLGLAGRVPALRRGLGDLSTVLRGGCRFVKDCGGWEEFFTDVAAKIPPPRLDDAAVRALAEGFVCDYASTRAKIARGELLAAQRWLHHHLAEANFRLLHELRQRRGQSSFPDARRLETTVEESARDLVAIDARLEPASLTAAMEKSAASLRMLVHDLVADTWRWPNSS